MGAAIHFGLKLNSSSRGLILTRENYATISNKRSLGENTIFLQAIKNNDEKLIRRLSEIYADTEGQIYRDEWCEKQLVKVMQNFDLNMQFFKGLDHAKLEHQISEFLKKTDFFEISDLGKFACPGYYVIILDHYCQLYIGTSSDIKERIRKHWSGGKLKFDRLIFGDVNSSRLSIDSFRALDTTRILIYPTNDLYTQENDFISCFSDEFVCNRIGGGNMEFGTLSVAANMKSRSLE